LLNYRGKELTLYDVEIWNQSAFEENEEPEPEPMERTMAVLKLTTGLGLTQCGIKMFEVIYWTSSEINHTRK
jgi:hypothetical protein